jgi:hypothetical protein
LFTDVPPGVITCTDAAPALPAGVIAKIATSPKTLKDVAALPPTETAVAPVKAVPEIVIVVPPASGPLTGETNVTVGTAAV